MHESAFHRCARSRRRRSRAVGLARLEEFARKARKLLHTTDWRRRPATGWLCAGGPLLPALSGAGVEPFLFGLGRAAACRILDGCSETRKVHCVLKLTRRWLFGAAQRRTHGRIVRAAEREISVGGTINPSSCRQHRPALFVGTMSRSGRPIDRPTRQRQMRPGSEREARHCGLHEALMQRARPHRHARGCAPHPLQIAADRPLEEQPSFPDARLARTVDHA